MRRVVSAILCLGLSCLTVTAQKQGPMMKGQRTGNSQQFEPLRKQFFDRHFAGNHPLPNAEFGGARAGAKVLEMRQKRAEALAARVKASAVSATEVNTSSLVLPGLTIRQPVLGAGSVPTAMATGDFNGDGHLDFAVANGGSNSIWIYLGNGDNTFQVPRIVNLKRGEGPVSMVAADLRKNGKIDLVVAEIDTGTVGVLLGNGDGTFANEAIYTLPQVAAAVTVNDFNHDGIPDIAVAMSNINPGSPVANMAMLPGNGDGTFASPIITYINNSFWNDGTAITIDSGDVNGDGYPDLLVILDLLELDGAVIVVPNLSLYLNNQDGTFRFSKMLSKADPLSVPTDGRLADVNEDGCLDALIPDLSEVVWVSLGDCSGNFAQASYVPMGGPATTVRTADLNGDGHLDLVTSSMIVEQFDFLVPTGTTLGVAMGDGKGNFASARVYPGASEQSTLTVGDFAGNQRPSVVTADYDTDTVTEFVNDGSGGFGSPGGFFSGRTMLGSVSANSYPTYADLNGDGKIDMFQLGEYNGVYYAMSYQNDGKGMLKPPVSSSFSAASSTLGLEDYRLGDFRNTGHQDVVAIGLNVAYTDSSQVIFFQPGNGDGTFGAATMTPTTDADGSMAMGDFNGDGKLDILAVNGTQMHKLIPFLGNGDGTFKTGTPVYFVDQNEDISRVYTGDFNRDGKLDVLVFTISNAYWVPYLTVWEFAGNGNGTFQSARKLFDSFQPFTLADVNHDGYPDMVRYDTMWPDGTTETNVPPKITIYTGQADGSFAQGASYSPYPSVIPVNLAPNIEIGDPLATSLVNDYSGDGNSDVAVVHNGYGSGRVMQMLMGNGDGTFVPTYDIFGFSHLFYPSFAHDLNQDGFADAMYTDSGGGTTIFFPGARAPALQMELESSIISGNSNCGYIFPDVASTSERTVTLNSSVAGVQLPGSLSVAAGALSAKFCYTLAPTYDQTRVHDIRATLDRDTAVAYASQQYTSEIEMSLSSANTEPVYQGGSAAPVTVTVTPQGGYSGTVKFSCSDLPAGYSCSFSSDQLTLSPGVPDATQLTVQTATGSSGNQPITVVADDGVSVRRQTLNVEIAALQVSTGASFDITSPGSKSVTVTVNGIAPYTFSCSGLPEGASCQFSGDQLSYPNSSSITVTVALPSGISPRKTTFSIVTQSGGFTVTQSETLNVFSFTMSAPSADYDWEPSSGSWMINIPVQMQNLGSAAMSISCYLDGVSVCQTLGMGVSSTAASIPIPINIPSGITQGRHTLSFTTTIFENQQTFSFPFWIADYSGTFATTSLSTKLGGTVTAAGTLTGTAGFSGKISLTCIAPALVGCSIYPAQVALTGDSSATFTVTLSAYSSAQNQPPIPLWSSLQAMTLAAVVPLGLVSWRKKRSWMRYFCMACLAASCISAISCGGGGGYSGNNGGNGTPTNYTVTISSYSSPTKISHTVGTITLTVNH